MDLSLKGVGIIVVGQFLIGPSLMAVESTKKIGNSAAESPEKDNSKINKRDDAVPSPTSDHQDNNKQDVEITRKIRSALTGNDALSTYAHNVKIITKNGQVLLKGPVRNADEKRVIEAAATQIAGGDRVKSELEVTPE